MQDSPTTLEYPYQRRLVPILAGGGTRLPAHVGILRALTELEVRVDHVVGVSGGSIVAALWAAGWPVDRLRKLALEVDFCQFRGFNLWQLLFHGGLSSGNHFERWMGEQLEGAVFTDLERDLHVVATDVRTGAPVIFDRYATPQLPVAQAVRYSMGIPLLFAFKEFGEQLLVDGSILSEDALRRDWAGDGTPACCFRLRAETEARARGVRRWFPFPDYMQMLLRAFMTTLSREFINDAFWNTTVVIDTGNVSPVEFNLSPGMKQMLFERGYQTTLEIYPRKFAM